MLSSIHRYAKPGLTSGSMLSKMCPVSGLLANLGGMTMISPAHIPARCQSKVIIFTRWETPQSTTANSATDHANYVHCT